MIGIRLARIREGEVVFRKLKLAWIFRHDTLLLCVGGFLRHCCSSLALRL
jgi:hypothetical protein